MTAPQKVSGYKCLEGNIHETLMECAECNAQTRIHEFVMGDKNDKNRASCFVAIGSPEKFSDSLPSNLAAAIVKSECDIVLHWITRQPEMLETIIRLFLEESSGDILEKVVKP